ncbi:AmmeMemoRadiSam system radical SAM enzyme [Candidatus Woesearchaeota archaeon]|nr:AmmeMemoRadiSam system radical SAM enzyme [Candidatus Woesearchaeota archaeon]
MDNMKKAMFYDVIKGTTVKCCLCPNFCVIKDGEKGSCNVRVNRKGTLYSMAYGLPYTANSDPVEKKPLFHFRPGSKTFSIATAGCNLHCLFCQNWQISQRGPEDMPCFRMDPEKVVAKAKEEGCDSISYTYVEPAVFYEYMLDIAKIAHKNGLKNIIVTNGYLNPEPVKLLYKHIDACNVDLKSFNEEFYIKYCNGRLQPILDTIKTIHKMGVWLELTTLMIPTMNDDMDVFKSQCEWIKDKLNDNVPLHISRFFPFYKLARLPPTPPETLDKAYMIAKDAGLNNVYIGNIKTAGKENTLCPKCKKTLIERVHHSISAKRMVNNRCPDCNTKIVGVFTD